MTTKQITPEIQKALQQLTVDRIESVVVRVGWSAGAKTHRGYRAVKVLDGTEYPYTSHTGCGTRGGTYGLGAAKVQPEGTPITCAKCAEQEAPAEPEQPAEVWENGTVSMASGARRAAIRFEQQVQVQTAKGDGWFVSKDAKVAASFKLDA